MDDARRKSIAVIPFADLSIEADQAHLCSGIADELIVNLSRLEGLKVASRASSLACKDRATGATEAGRTLGVDVVLSGSISKPEGNLQVTAELVDVVDDASLWSDHFVVATTDIFTVPEEIAHRVAETLQLHLTDAQLRAISRAGTRNLAAYELYLQGRQFFFGSNRKGIDAATEMFNQAIQKDPSYALAYAGLADSYAYRFMYYDPDPANLKMARNTSTHSLSLDHDLAEAHAARGLAVSLSERYDEAEAEFEEAIRLDPQLFEAHYFYARTCFAQGKYEQACRLYETASRVNPDDAQSLTLLAFTYRTMGDEARALEVSQQALVRLERLLSLNPDDPRLIYLSADALAQIGNRDEALRRAERAASLDPDDPYAMYGLACIYSRLGEQDKALTALETATTCGFGHKAWIINDSDFDPIRDDPRFQAILDKLAPA